MTENDNECFICLETTNEPVLNIQQYETDRTCDCKAFIHGQCYAKWLYHNKSCPVCRNNITTINGVVIQQTPPEPQIQEIIIDRLPNYFDARQTINIMNEDYLFAILFLFVLTGIFIYLILF